MAFEVVVEHLNNLRIVAEVCREIGVAEWLNAQGPTSRQQVSVGTATVTWMNQDSAPHTVTFKNGMKDSGLLGQGQSFSYTFTTPGTFDYYCTVHPNVVAHVIVTA